MARRAYAAAILLTVAVTASACGDGGSRNRSPDAGHDGNAPDVSAGGDSGGGTGGSGSGGAMSGGGGAAGGPAAGSGGAAAAGGTSGGPGTGGGTSGGGGGATGTGTGGAAGSGGAAATGGTSGGRGTGGSTGGGGGARGTGGGGVAGTGGTTAGSGGAGLPGSGGSGTAGTGGAAAGTGGAGTTGTGGAAAGTGGTGTTGTGGAIGTGGSSGSGGETGSGGSGGETGSGGSGNDTGGGGGGETGSGGSGGETGGGSGGETGSGGSGGATGSGGANGTGGAGAAPATCGDRQYPCGDACCMFQGGHRDLRGARPARSVSMDFVGSQPYFLTGMEDFSMAFFTFGPTGVEGIPVDLDGGILGNSVTLRFDAATNAQVVYFRGGFDEIIHGHHVLGDTWFTRTDVLAGVLQANNGGDNFLAMDLNPSQEPEIVFAESKRLRHAARSGGAWSFTYLDDVQGSVSAPAIIIAPDGTRHVAYVAGSREVRYAQGTGPTWSTQVLGPAMHAETDLALGPDGTLHLLYSSALNGGPPYELRHAWLPIGGTWQHETTWTSATGWLREAAIAVGNDGAVHIAFFARAEYAVFYQYRSPGGVWATPSLLDITFADSYTAVDAAIDPNGKLHIVYVARMMYHFWQ